MKQKVIDHFAALGKFKVTFNPAIKIKLTPHSQPTWIDDMCRVNNTYMFTISTIDDNRKINIDSLQPIELQSLNTRLWSMVDQQKKTA